MNTSQGSRVVVSALAAVSLLAGCEGRPASPASTDARTPIEVPGPVRDAILEEMRTMLGSLNTLLAGWSRNDRAAMQDAAAASGLAGAADPALESLLPDDFLRMGMGTHRRFDELAGAIAAGAERDTIVAALAELTGNCVACHAVYRLEVQ